MKRIQKSIPPPCLTEFIRQQQAIEPTPVNLTYGNLPRKAELLAQLTAEQFGLCGYTGAPVDDRRIANLNGPAVGVRFCNHVEHVKPQNVCKSELVATGGVPGRDLCEDLAYDNVIAALAVNGSEAEHFGAVLNTNGPPAVTPLEPCEGRFRFREADGVVEGLDGAAKNCVDYLRLNHETLKGWRLRALQTWLAPEVVATAADLRGVMSAVTEPVDGTLPEFAYVVEAVVRGYLDEANV